MDEPAYEVVRALLRRRDGGDRLFVYGEGRAWHEVHAEDPNAYLRKHSGSDITAKDFRTRHATVLAAVALAVSASVADGSRATRAKAERRAVQEVSGCLGNTPAVCRASYIDPVVVERFEEGVTIAPVLGRLGEDGGFGHPATRGAVERAVLRPVDRVPRASPRARRAEDTAGRAGLAAPPLGRRGRRRPLRRGSGAPAQDRAEAAGRAPHLLGDDEDLRVRGHAGA
ncbi:hypothetical protein [Streptomyces litmocidini]|uniref:hypothetical protein n=1 Tax=Streptomyces litmocidini TaxID=67318 RepID=UPI0036FA6714